MYMMLKSEITNKRFTKVEAEKLQKKLDIFLYVDRITGDEYKELTALLVEKTINEEVSKEKEVVEPK